MLGLFQRHTLAVRVILKWVDSRYSRVWSWSLPHAAWELVTWSQSSFPNASSLLFSNTHDHELHTQTIACSVSGSHPLSFLWTEWTGLRLLWHLCLYPLDADLLKFYYPPYPPCPRFDHCGWVLYPLYWSAWCIIGRLVYQLSYKGWVGHFMLLVEVGHPAG